MNKKELIEKLDRILFLMEQEEYSVAETELYELIYQVEKQ